MENVLFELRSVPIEKGSKEADGGGLSIETCVPGVIFGTYLTALWKYFLHRRCDLVKLVPILAFIVYSLLRNRSPILSAGMSVVT